MGDPLRVLIIEDSENDALLLVQELRRGGFDPVFEQVETAQAMKAALEKSTWDLVTSDFSMPDFSGPDALKILQESGLDLPFLTVSGTIGEETAVASMKAGAHDFLLKDNLIRLVPAARRELREAKIREKHRRVEQALRESEVRYRAVMEQSPEGIYLVDVETKCIVEANPAFQNLLGYTAEEILKLSIYDFIAADREDIDRKYQALLRKENPQTLERRLRRKDGSLLDVVTSAKAIFYGGRKVTCTVVHDVTQQKLAEEVLKESEARYRAVIEQSADGIYLIEVQSKRLLEANQAFRDLLGYSADEVQELTLYDIVAAGQEDIDYRIHENLSAERRVTYERKYRKKDGSVVDVWITANLLSYRGKQVICFFVRDLTEKKALEGQFLRAQRMESIGLLAGGIAHDLNNILTPILMNTELLKREIPGGSGQKILTSMVSSAQRASDIVKQILTFARGMEGDHIGISPKYLLKEMEQFARETFPRSIIITAEVPPGLWIISGDPAQLHQVLLNLCMNAKDAMPDGGTLTLSAENVSLDDTYARMHPEAKPGSYVSLTVSDTGTGIPNSLIDRIFEPFFTTKVRGRGTGLGLSTVHGIVRSHGGFIRILSEVGKGSRFQVFLPASPSTETTSPKGKAIFLPRGKGELILVVDDEPSIRETAQAVLEAQGYQVLTAADGADAVALYALHQGSIRAVITDVAMPVMDGLATIRALQRIDPKVSVITMSGMASTDITEGLRPEIAPSLQKPFTSQMLLEIVRDVLQEVQNQRDCKEKSSLDQGGRAGYE